MSAFNPIAALLLTSLVGAATLAFVRDYRWSARLNVVASLIVLLSALALFFQRPPVNAFFIADDYVFSYGASRGLYRIVDGFWFPLDQVGAEAEFWRHGDFIYAYPAVGEPFYWVNG